MPAESTADALAQAVALDDGAENPLGGGRAANVAEADEDDVDAGVGGLWHGILSRPWIIMTGAAADKGS